jgi:hypothetical protein
MLLIQFLARCNVNLIDMKWHTIYIRLNREVAMSHILRENISKECIKQ